MMKRYYANASNETLLADARAYRKGITYYGGSKTRKAIDQEIAYRKKTGQIKSTAKGTYNRNNTATGFGLVIPKSSLGKVRFKFY